MKTLDIQIFDAFTDEIFSGNIAGVVTRAEGLNHAEMQKIATEIGSPTTGFAMQRDNAVFEVRFYTPTQEIDMCGHVVVGLFCGLAFEGRLPFNDEGKAKIQQNTKAGIIPVEIRKIDAKSFSVYMEQNKPYFRNSNVSIKRIAELLAISASEVNADYPVQIVSTALNHLIVPLNGLRVAGCIDPDFNRLAALSKKLNIETIGLFTLETISSDCSVHVRDLCPGIGNPEEAASGTTNGALGCYLIKNGLVDVPENGIVKIKAEQGHEMGRPSTILSKIVVSGNRIKKVKVGGSAVRSLKAEMYLHGG